MTPSCSKQSHAAGCTAREIASLRGRQACRAERGRADLAYSPSRKNGSGLALAFDTLPERAGILTPAAAMGDALTERLAAADGFTLEVERV